MLMPDIRRPFPFSHAVSPHHTIQLQRLLMQNQSLIMALRTSCCANPDAMTRTEFKSFCEVCVSCAELPV
jgi:hypothetical protein